MIPEWVYFLVLGVSLFIAFFPLYEIILDKKDRQSTEATRQ